MALSANDRNATPLIPANLAAHTALIQPSSKLPCLANRVFSLDPASRPADNGVSADTWDHGYHEQILALAAAPSAS